MDTFAASHITDTSKKPGCAADLAEFRKLEKYNNIEKDFLFVPLGIETSGSWGENARKLVSEIGSKLQRSSGEPRSSSYLRQRISIAIQRGNSASVLSTIPPSFSLEEIFMLV